MNGAPFLCSYLSSVVFCYAADFIIARNLMSLTNVRKMFTAICKYQTVFDSCLLPLITYSLIMFVCIFFSSSISWSISVNHWLFRL